MTVEEQTIEGQLPELPPLEPVPAYDESDPLIADMAQAQKEIDAIEAAKTEANPDAVAAPAATTTEVISEPKAHDSSIMVPKERLDEVIRQRDQYKAAAQYTQGVNDALRSNLRPDEAKPAEPAAKVEAGPTYDEKINAAEQQKIALAEKFDSGEINLKELRTHEVELDKQIRTLADERHKAQINELKVESTKVSQAQAIEAAAYNATVDIQKNHPYVAEIDNLPYAVKRVAWEVIANEAQQMLRSQGINPNDGTANSRIAFINAKAQLTDKYGPQYTGKNLSQQSVQQKPVLSQNAQNRSAKLELAAQQPPAISNLGVVDTKSELSSAQIESMSDDQIADMLARNRNSLDGILRGA